MTVSAHDTQPCLYPGQPHFLSPLLTRMVSGFAAPRSPPFLQAPLVPHMAEDAWLSLPYPAPAPSVFQAGWAVPDAEWSSLAADEAALWGAVAEVRTAVNTVMERARSDKAIGAGLEAKVRRGAGVRGGTVTL